MAQTVKVINGHILPDLTTVRKVIKQLNDDVKKDRKLAASLKSNPRKVLGARGLSIDVQNELLREAGRRIGGTAADCTGTCVCSGCCLTGHKELGDVVLPALKAG